jgi:hypothetical protein
MTKGLLKATVTLEVVAARYRVFPTNDGRFAVAYHITGSLWGVAGDAATELLANELCDHMNKEHERGSRNHPL